MAFARLLGMSILCHISDLYLGYRRFNRLSAQGFNQREVDVNAAFSEAVSRIILLRPNLVVVAGDIFHAVRPSNSVLTFAFKEFSRLARALKSPIVIVGGNHEAPRRSDVGSPLTILAEIPGVFIAEDDYASFPFEELGINVVCLPHLALLKPLPALSANDRYRYNVLVAHAQVGGDWISDFGGAEVALSALKPHEWDYMAFGHVHIQKNLGLNGAYSGSIEGTSANIWSEAERNKGFLEVDLASKKRTFHVLTSPRQVVALPALVLRGLSPAEATAAIVEQLQTIPGGVEGKIIKVTLTGLTRATFTQLDHREIRDWRARAFNLTIETQFEEVLNPLASGKRIRSVSDEMVEFTDSWNSTLFKSGELKKLIGEYSDKVREAP